MDLLNQHERGPEWGNLAKWKRPGTSPECARCYAEALSLRRGWTKAPWAEENAAANVRLHPERMREWEKLPVPDRIVIRPSERTRVFVCSMGDLFHELVPDAFLVECFRQFRRHPHIDFMVLTKRIERAADPAGPWCSDRAGGWPRHVHLGTTVGHPVTKWRIKLLHRSPAPVRFVSIEPLVASLTDRAADGIFGPLDLYGIDQIIVGGESGSGFRRMEMQWARDLRDRCQRTGTAFFFKQDAAFRAGTRPWLVEADGRRMEYKQFPGELTPPRAIGESEMVASEQADPFPIV
jgi:protein gp37